MQVAGAAATAQAAGLTGRADPAGIAAASGKGSGDQPAESITANSTAATAGETLARPGAFAAVAQQPEVTVRREAAAAHDSGSEGEGMGALGSLFDDSGIQEAVQGAAAATAGADDDCSLQDRTGQDLSRNTG